MPTTLLSETLLLSVAWPAAEVWRVGSLCCGDAAELHLCHWLQMLLRSTGEGSGTLRCLLLAPSLADEEGCWLLGSSARTCFQA